MSKVTIVYPEGVTEKEVNLFEALIKAGVPFMKAFSFMAAITAPNPERN